MGPYIVQILFFGPGLVPLGQACNFMRNAGILASQAATANLFRLWNWKEECRAMTKKTRSAISRWMHQFSARQLCSGPTLWLPMFDFTDVWFSWCLIYWCLIYWCLTPRAMAFGLWLHCSYNINFVNCWATTKKTRNVISSRMHRLSARQLCSGPTSRRISRLVFKS